MNVIELYYVIIPAYLSEKLIAFEKWYTNRHRHLLQEEKSHTVDIVEGTGVRENAWNFQNVI